MQRMFLGSAGLGALPFWMSSLSLTTRRAVLVPTAANPLPCAPYVDAAEHLLLREGMTVDRLDLEDADEPEVEPALRKADLVFVAGGYAMFLLQHVRRTGFDRIVTPAVRSGRLSYVGISAGAALAGPDLGFLRDPEDPGAVETTAGLDLVPFTMLPHRNRGRAERHDRHATGHTEGTFISINDDQAVTVEGNGFKILESP